ncbi:MAG TPA: hypothetical protein VGO31_12855 [Microbacteriaceae bacterium]|nr:hypothetical protein [Microbacteriaceae bacterium]
MTTDANPVSVSYVRDAADRIVSQTTTAAGVTKTVRYSFTGGGDIPDFTLDTANVVQEHTLGLPGGVTVSIQSSSQVWSYPNLHGDVIVTTDAVGPAGWCRPARPVRSADRPGHRDIGTTAANNTVTPGSSYGWVGSNQKLFQHAGDIATIEMGARQYVAALDRFSGWIRSRAATSTIICTRTTR